MAKLTSIKLDMKKVNEGIWFLFMADIEVLVARKPNSVYLEKLECLMEPHMQNIRNGKFTQAQDRELTIEAVVGTVLLNWKNIEDDRGKTIPFSVAEALAILSDPSFEDFYNFILQCAHDREQYRVNSEAEAVKNLQSA